MSNKVDNNNQHIASDPDLAGVHTAADYVQLSMNELVELVRGKMMKMSPSPTSNHLSVCLQLILQS